MDIEFDPAKDAINRRKHGLPLELAAGFDIDTAIKIDDLRWDYGERRQIAFGLIGARLHTMVFTMRGSIYRIISLRKSNIREQADYVASKAEA